MLRFKLVLTTLAVLSVTSSLAIAADAAADTAVDTVVDTGACTITQLAAIRTDFPQASQSRGEHGDVTLKVAIGKDGRASQAQVTQSSGYAALDKAAADSVTQYWRFDVSHCAASALPADSLVVVQFQRAVRQTMYGTINRHRTANNAQVQSSCDKVRDAAGDQIVACLADASLAGRNVPPTLANRTELSQRK